MKQVMRNLAPLPMVELYLYSVVVVCGIGKSLLDAFYFLNEVKQFYSPNSLTRGWNFLSKDKDVADYDWTTWSKSFVEFIPWTIVHVVISQVLWWKMTWFIPFFYILFSSVSMIKFMGVYPTLILFLYALIMFLTSFYKKRRLCWITGMVVLLFITHPRTKLLDIIFDDNSVEKSLFLIGVTWMNIRTLSFCLHRCSEWNVYKSVKLDLIHYLGFCFYYPLLYFGPLMMFNDFEKQLLSAKPKRNLVMLATCVANVIRIIFWSFFHEMVLHYFYIYALSKNPTLAKTCSNLTPAGILLMFLASFHLKYILFYGMSRTIAQFEEFEPPAIPACFFSLCHQVSSIWRYFDRGLYEFFKRYIYIPVLGENKGLVQKIFASAVCFLFVFVWHGTSYEIFRWSCLNFIEILLEMLAAAFVATKTYTKLQERWISPVMARRLRSFFSIPLIYLGLISNLYFTAGGTLTDIVVDKGLFNASWNVFLFQSFGIYCLCNLTMEIENRRVKGPGKECLSYKSKET